MYSEKEIAPIVYGIITDNPGIRTSELIDMARDYMKPTGDDLTILKNRRDDKFSQKVRNIKSHDSLSDHVYTIGKRNRRWYAA